MRKNKNKQKILAIFLLFYFFLNFTVYANFHYHITTSGSLIVHGHPYDKSQDHNSPIKAHSHSSNELLLYFTLFNIELLICVLFLLVLFTKLICYVAIHNTQFVVNNTFFLLPSLRAPPVFLF